MLTSRIRLALNRVLNPLGMSISSTRLETIEQTRLAAAEHRGHWSQPRYGQGLKFDDAAYLRLLDELCRPHAAAYNVLPAHGDPNQAGYYVRNDWFASVDAEVYYSILRHSRPRQIIEVGSGFSSRLARRAITDGALATRLTCIDPSPRVDVQSFADEHLACRAEELPPERISGSLASGDILFIDSSHIVATAGDVPFLFLEVLPRLPAGVWVHVHDIFLPFEYPRAWVIEHRWGWNEQYLVHALLYGNHAIEVVWPAWYMWQTHRPAIEAVIPSAQGGAFPTSFWLRIVEPSDPAV
ncbi:MAG TPA: class I SAM-dependent methyltransferase [Pirellulales bacterium]|jgi:hypothetical protein|nr:class I SAM-dependent methyltransferase [Pirellulales bacterium]